MSEGEARPWWYRPFFTVFVGGTIGLLLLVVGIIVTGEVNATKPTGELVTGPRNEIVTGAQCEQRIAAAVQAIGEQIQEQSAIRGEKDEATEELVVALKQSVALRDRRIEDLEEELETLTAMLGDCE